MLAIQARLREMRWIATPHDDNKEDPINDAFQEMGLVNKWRRARVDADEALQSALVEDTAAVSRRSWRAEQLEGWAKMLEETTASPEMDSVWTKELLGRIDEVYVQEVSECWEFSALETKDATGTRYATVWSEAMERYDERVTDVVTEVRVRVREEEPASEASWATTTTRGESKNRTTGMGIFPHPSCFDFIQVSSGPIQFLSHTFTATSLNKGCVGCLMRSLVLPPGAQPLASADRSGNQSEDTNY